MIYIDIQGEMTMFSDNLKRIRREKGLTQIQLAEQLNCSQNEICRWESGTAPSIPNLVRIADALGCTVDELVRDK